MSLFANYSSYIKRVMRQMGSLIHRVTIVLLVLVIWFGAALHGRAQTPQSDAAPGQNGNSTEEDTGAKRTKEDSHRSISETLVASMRSPVAFSVDFMQLYTPDVFATSGKQAYVGFTLLRPRIFTRTTTKRYDFHFDYLFDYRVNNRQHQFQSSDHTVNVDFTRLLSSHVSLQFSDNFRSVFNDLSVLPQASAPVLYQPGVAQELYVPQQRFTTNSVVTSVHYQAAKRININVFSSYNLWRYSTGTFGTTQGFQAGIRGDYRVNKWLYLDSSYSHYMNRVDPRFQPANIHRLQVGGLKFRPRRTVELYLSGGVDSTRLEGTQRTAASFDAGASKSSGTTLLSLVYHRGLSVAGGPGAILSSNTVNVSFSQWLSRRVNVNFNSGYVEGASVIRGSKLRYLTGTAEFGVRLQQHVTFSTQYTYISQRGANLGSTTPTLKRYSLMAGFQFFFASLGHRRQFPTPQ